MEPATGDRALAHAKILCHLQELSPQLLAPTMTGLNAQNRERLRAESLRWVFEGRSDFADWCESAGLEPEYVRKKAREIYEQGYKWRLGSGERKNMSSEELKIYNAKKARVYRRNKLGRSIDSKPRRREYE